MRILHVITQLTHGGHESQLYDAIRATRDACDHRVISLSPGGHYRDLLTDLGIPVVDLRRRGRGDPHRLVRLVSEMREFRPDIVHGHLFTGNFYGFLALRLAFPVGSRPALITVRVTTSPKRARLVDRLEAMAFRASRFVLVNAEALLPEIHETYGISPKRIRFLPNALVPEKFDVTASHREVREELSAVAGDVVIGHIGSFSPEKRHDLLLDAFAAAVETEPRLRLVLVGDGPTRERSEAHARELNLDGSVRWLGWREDVPRLLKGMDITVNCSDREGSCNAILESMATGVPVIATSVGGTPEALQGGDAGVLVPPGDADALSRAMVSLSDDAGRRNALSTTARESVWERHGPDQVYPLLLSIYRDAMSPNAGRSLS